MDFGPYIVLNFSLLFDIVYLCSLALRNIIRTCIIFLAFSWHPEKLFVLQQLFFTLPMHQCWYLPKFSSRLSVLSHLNQWISSTAKVKSLGIRKTYVLNPSSAIDYIYLLWTDLGLSELCSVIIGQDWLYYLIELIWGINIIMCKKHHMSSQIIVLLQYFLCHCLFTGV